MQEAVIDSKISLTSKLPSVGTTIFTRMSTLAAEKGAVNLGQGYPDFDCDRKLVDAVYQAMLDGHNQYPPMTGIAHLRQAVADKIERLYGHSYNADREITITAGATQAIITAILAVVHPGDEVIVLEPCYDSYIPSVQLAGGVVIPVSLQPGTFRPDLAAIAAAITPKTRALIINSPHNPSATVWSDAEMQALDAILQPTSVLLISDEVYEHMVFDAASHQSAARYPGLVARAFIVSSFGKTFHVTGWKVGSIAAPAHLMAEFRKVHQFNVFTVNTPMQYALAAYLADPAPYLELPDFYQRKRDYFLAGLQRTRFQPLHTQGSYFQCADIRAVPDAQGRSDADFCLWLTAEIGVAAIPLSAFYGSGLDQRIIRFCFAKKDQTLKLALERLAKL